MNQDENSSLEMGSYSSLEGMVDEGNKSNYGGEICPASHSGNMDPSLLETHILYA